MKRLFFLICLGLGFTAAPPDILAFKASERPALRDYDRRLDGLPKTAELVGERADAAARLKDRVADLKISVDPLLGSPKFIASTHDFLSGPNGEGKGISLQMLQAIPLSDTQRVIKAFLNEHSGLFGYGSEVLNTARLKRDYATAHNGMRTVVWEQQLDGISVYGAVMIGNLTKKGELVNLSTLFVPNAAQAADLGTPNRGTLEIVPAISAQQAVVNAATAIEEALGLNQLASIDPQPVGAEKSQRFSATPVLNGETKAELVWLPMNRNALRLCWQVRLTSHARGETFLVLVDVQTGQALLRRSLTVHITNSTYNVWTSDSPSPFSPGLALPGNTQPALVPRVMVVTNALDTNASPNGWIDDTVNETRGNNVDAHLDRNADDQPDLPRPQGTTNRVFDFPIDLTKAPSTYGDGAVVQLFYWVNYHHDRLYQLGFTEAAGNYQNDNFGRGGLGNDAVLADAQDGSGFNNANFTFAPDGSPGRIQMYIFDGPTPDRDGDFDAEVMLHENTHGTSTRLVGGGVGISQLQTGGMGEGWSDFYGLCLLSETGDNVGGNYAAGGYVTLDIIPNFLQNYYFGIRRYPYTTNLLANPLTFKDIDPNQADPHPGIPISPLFSPFDPSGADEVHNQGEVWCVTLWEARAALINKFSPAVGNQLILQLVTDGMKLAPVDPNFLEARDAIIQADLVDNGGANFNELWTAFAKRGMGGSATSPNSATTLGVQEAFDLPGLAIKGATTIDAFTGNGNGVVDPNECTELNIALVNNGRFLATGISVTLSTTTPGVLISQPTSTYPNIPGGGTGTNAVPFKFYTAPNFLCGTPIVFSVRIQSVQDTRVATLRLPTGLVGSPIRFNNDTPVAIPDADLNGVDSAIVVSGLDSAISKVTVSLHLTHTFDFDLVLQLIAPDGTRILLSNHEGFFGVNFGVSCAPDTQRTTFDDKADLPISAGFPPYVGSFRPEQPLTAFVGKSGTQVNGTWRLHIVDSFFFDTGSLQCWSLNLSPTTCTDGGGDCSTDLGVSSSSAPNTLIVGSNLTYSILVTNNGPNAARNVVLTDTLPAGVNYVSATPSRGSCSQAAGIVTCSLGSLANGESASVAILTRPTTVGLITNVATVTSSVTDPNLTNNTSILIGDVHPPIAVIVPDSAALLFESISPPSGGIDAGEIVTLNLLLRNIGSLNTTNLVATLLPTGGVTNPSAPQTYGVVAAGGPAVGRQFTFTATGTNGGIIAITLQLVDGTNSLGTATFTFGLGALTSWVNQGVIIINDNTNATPYPSSIFVSGLSGLINKVTVSVSNMNHTYPSDVDMLLVGPGGRSVLLMSDAGAGYDLNNVNLTFDDAASVSLPYAQLILSGTYKATDFSGSLDSPDNFPAPAPVPPYGSALSVFNGGDPNGTWSLYVVDSVFAESGRITSGWRLNLTTVDPVNPTADLLVMASGTPNPILAGSNLTYTVLVTNLGPDAATSVRLTNTLPSTAAFLSATNSQGTNSVANGKVIFDLGTITNRGWATVSIIAIPTLSGSITNVASVGANEVDRNAANSTASVVTTVSPAADIAVSVAASPEPATIGNNLTYTITVTNNGPNNASGVSLTNTLPAGVAFISANSSQGTCGQANGIVNCSLGAIPKFSKVAVTIVVQPSAVALLTNVARVASTSPVDLISTNNTASRVTQANNPSLVLVPGGTVLLAENPPPTGGIEAGETVTVNFGLKNVGIADTTSLQATLRNNSGGVTNAGGSQNYGVVVAGGPAVMRPFTFTAQGTNGGTITASLNLQDGAINLGSVAFTFVLGTVTPLVNGGSISIPDNGPAIPYPSVITVSNLAGVVSKVVVTFNGLTHAYPDDIDALLISPGGQAALLMSDCGGGNGINNVTLTFDDDATNSLPNSTQIQSGIYKPTNYGNGDIFAPPAPAGPYVSTLSVFNGSNPNGAWSLCVIDDTFGDLGGLNGGWSLAITTVGRINPPPARLTLPTQLDLSSFQLTVHGEVGDTFIIEAAGEITGPWTQIATLTLTSVSLDFQDPDAGTYGRRFYRARRP